MKIIALITSVSGAVGGTFVAGGYVAPIIKSDSAPWQGKAQLQKYAQSVDSAIIQLQRNNAALAAHQNSSDQVVSILRMGELEGELDRANADAKKNPHSTSAHILICSLIMQIDPLRVQNHLPTIPPC